MKLEDLVTQLKDASTFSCAMSKLKGMRLALINLRDPKGYSLINMTIREARDDYSIVMFDHPLTNMNDIPGLYYYTTNALYGVREEEK